MELVHLLTQRLVACRLRESVSADHDVCREIYRTNVPDGVPAEGLPHYEAFLEEGTSYHLVVERGDSVVASGGLTLRGEGPYARLMHGMVLQGLHRQGLGSTLLAARLALLEPEGAPVHVDLMSRESAASFYSQYGFHLQSVVPDPFRPGENYGQMILTVQPEEVEALRDLLPSHGVILEITEIPVSEDGDLLAED